MKKRVCLGSLCMFLIGALAQEVADNMPDTNPPAEIPGYKLVWNDEFDYDGKPNSEYWNYETGFQRNEELQWYQEANANCKNHVLVLEGKRERFPNPNYQAGSSDWKRNREYVDYTSACVITQGKKSWKFGRFEVRARIPIDQGAWPAIWTLGINKEWPSNGEIDILELYLKNGYPHIWANAAWGTSQRWVAAWNSSYTNLYSIIRQKGMTNEEWADNFHVWVMDWTEEYIRLYMDDQLLNDIDLSKTVNPDGFNPFHQEHYLLLNLALGANGGDPSGTEFPLKYEIDYARVYQKDETSHASAVNAESWQVLYPGNDARFLTIKNNQQTDTAVCSIYDATGKVLVTRKIKEEETFVDVSSFSHGIYFVKLHRENGCETHKFMKI